MIRFVFITLCILATYLPGQNSASAWGLFNLQSYTGLVGIEALHRNQTTVLANGYSENPVTSNFTARFLLNTQSYIWHPSFMGINLNMDYNPGVKNEAFIATPNRSETRTAENVRLMLNFFKERPFNFNYFYNYSHSFTNREYASSVESLSQEYGANISFRNKIVPLSMQYINSSWDQLEVSSSRRYVNFRESIQTNLNKSFGFGDKHSLLYSYQDYQRNYANSDTVRSFYNNIRLQNYLPLNKEKTSNFRSMINLHEQHGNQGYSRLQINENLIYKLPLNFSLTGNYSFSDMDDDYQNTKQHNLLGRVKHQLFSSLRTSAFYELINVANTAYDEQSRNAGFSLDYKKNIRVGSFNFAYDYRNRRDSRSGGLNRLVVSREEKFLLDGETTLLEYPYADLASVIVRDETGTITYDENLDYVLIAREDYIEIQRIPGGQIVNGQAVYIDYRVLRSISFAYTTNSHGISTGFDLFKRLFQFYYRYNEQTYDNLHLLDPTILKTLNQNVYGLRIKKNIFTLGAEYNLYKSNIVPYETTRYFAKISKRLNSLFFIINMNYLDRFLIEDRENQRFFDISGQMNINIQRMGKISFYLGYRNQMGRSIDLNLRNFKIEYTGRYRALYFSTGIEIYRRKFLQESISYNGAFLKLERRF